MELHQFYTSVSEKTVMLMEYWPTFGGIIPQNLPIDHILQVRMSLLLHDSHVLPPSVGPCRGLFQRLNWGHPLGVIAAAEAQINYTDGLASQTTHIPFYRALALISPLWNNMEGTWWRFFHWTPPVCITARGHDLVPDSGGRHLSGFCLLRSIKVCLQTDAGI